MLTYTKPADGAEWLRVQTGMFGLVQSDTITEASEVTEASIQDYLLTAVLDQRICDVEKQTYDGSFSFTSPHS